MADIEDTKYPGKLDYIEAWNITVALMVPKMAAEQASYMAGAYPIPEDVWDPIFWTPDGWHRAQDITGPDTMRQMETQLHKMGFVLPQGLVMKWEGVRERAQWATDVRTRVNDAIKRLLPDQFGPASLMEAVIADLQEQLRSMA